MKKRQTTKSGFSLVESMIAVFIFSLVAIMLTGVFSGFLKSYKSAKKAQRSAESAQYAINLMAKSIRSSTFAPGVTFGPMNQVMRMFDKSRSQCVVYKYAYGAGVLQLATPAGTDIASCATPQPGDFRPLTKAGDIAGVSFIGSASEGKILISVDTGGGEASQIQTTISLRD